MESSTIELRLLLQYAEFRGLDSDELLHFARIKPEILNFPYHPVSFAEIDRVWLKSLESLADPHFGLHFGRFIQLKSLDMFGHIMMNCETVEDFYRHTSKYQRMVTNHISYQIDKLSNGDIFIRHIITNDTPELQSQYEEHFQSSGYGVLSMLTDGEIKFREVWFTTPKPEDQRELQNRFKSRLRFEQKSCAFIIPPEFYYAPIKFSNAHLRDLFAKYADEIIADSQQNNLISRQVNLVLSRDIKPGIPTIEDTAKALSIGVRTLQKKLKLEKTSFRKILEEVRKNQAISYLMDKTLSIKEISAKLDYNEPAAFSVSFKKWMNLSPSEYRMRHLSSDQNNENGNL